MDSKPGRVPAHLCLIPILTLALSGCGGPLNAGPSASPGDYLVEFTTSNLATVLDSTLDNSTGQIGPLALSGASICNNSGAPGTYAVTPSKTFFYAFNLCGAAIEIYLIVSPGLTLVEQPSYYILLSQGDPMTLAVDRTGRFLYCVTQGQQSQVLEFAIDGSNGNLTLGSTVTQASALSTVITDPAADFVFADAGESIFAYQIQDNGSLTAVPGSPFALPGQPSRFAIENNGHFLFAILPSGGVAVMAIDSATGALSNVPGSPFATNLFPTTLAADPSGRFLYMAVFGDPEIQGFNVDATSGGLTEMAGSPFSSPVTANSLVVNSAGTFVYLSSWAYPAPTSSIAGFAIDSSNGSLTPISGSPLNAGQGLGGILELSIP